MASFVEAYELTGHRLPPSWRHLKHSVREFQRAASLAELAESDGDFDNARRALEQAIDVGALVEDLYRRLIRLYLVAGRDQDVHGVYRQLVAALRTIGAQPDDATEALVRAISRAGADASQDVRRHPPRAIGRPA